MTMYRVRNVFSGLQGTPYLATHYFDASSGTAQQAVDEVAAYWTAVDINMDSEITWRTEDVVDSINEANGALVSSTGTTSAIGSGGSVGPVLPFAIQGLVRWATAGIVAGRRVKGRLFIPGLTENQVDNGLVTAAVISSFNTAGAAYIAGLTTIPVVWSRPFAGKPTAVPPQPARSGTMHPITSASMWNNGAVLRSRRS